MRLAVDPLVSGRVSGLNHPSSLPLASSRIRILTPSINTSYMLDPTTLNNTTTTTDIAHSPIPILTPPSMINTLYRLDHTTLNTTTITNPPPYLLSLEGRQIR